MPAPDLSIPDDETFDRALTYTRAGMRMATEALLGSLLLAGILTWATHAIAGGWVPWSVFAMGATAGWAFDVLLGLAQGGWQCYRLARARSQLSRDRFGNHRPWEVIR